MKISGTEWYGPSKGERHEDGTIELFLFSWDADGEAGHFSGVAVRIIDISANKGRVR